VNFFGLNTIKQLFTGFFRTWRTFGFATTLRLTVFYSVKVLKNLRRYPTTTSMNDLNRAIEFSVEDIDFDTLPSGSMGTLERATPYVWYVPAWTNVWGGGHFTLFRYANLMSKLRPQIIYIYNNQGRFSKNYFKDSLQVAFPDNTITILTDPSELPSVSIPIATTWQSVFSLLKTTSSDTGPRFYFMQDYENLFYSHGTESMQAIDSYEHGLIGITGGPWLLSQFRKHGGDGMNYQFTTDAKIFFPAEKIRRSVKRIFFYGRPSTERRCFELGVETLRLLKSKYPEIEIVVAGLDGIGPLGFDATLSGSVPLPELGNLYRSCDIGLALSGTNLSYLPVELMAVGVPVVTNGGPHVEWYCEDGVNSLVAPPFPTEMLKRIEMLIQDEELRLKLRENGLKKSRETSWELEAEKIQTFVESKLPI
jgi:glycosyltransferase involved in cell wall biosynthesis